MMTPVITLVNFEFCTDPCFECLIDGQRDMESARYESSLPLAYVVILDRTCAQSQVGLFLAFLFL